MRRAPVSGAGRTLPSPAPAHPEACMSQAFPLCDPTSGRDTIDCRHRTHQGARLSLSKLLYVFPRGEEAQGCVGTDLWASAW